MTTRFKDFGSPESSHEPLSFSLFGETFECQTALQGKFLLDLVAGSGSEDPATSAAIVTKFFDTVLTTESSERFTSLTNDPDKIISVETLGSITEWLVSEYAERPTERSEI
jgi:hypothetical protein